MVGKLEKITKQKRDKKIYKKNITLKNKKKSSELGRTF
jgi:hypothetical protein